MEKPLFLIAAENIAAERGITPQEVLDGDLRRLEESSYPTPDCLYPHEAERVVYGDELPPHREAHRQSCILCHILAMDLHEQYLDLLEDLDTDEEGQSLTGVPVDRSELLAS